MSAPDPLSANSPPHREAVVWMSRLDRGLTPAEQDAFFTWLGTSPANGAALERCRRRWRRLDRLADWRPELGAAPNPDLLAPRPRSRWLRRLAPALLAAACLALALAYWRPFERTVEPAVAAASPAAEDRRIMPDGSVLKLNAGAVFSVLYTGTERRIRLERGEAFFKVMKDPARPFVVEAGGATVQALGTAFNVRLGAGELDVLVAEGTVGVARPVEPVAGRDLTLAPDPTVLVANQRVSLSLADRNGMKQIATLTRREIQQTLAWQHGLMTFREQPLAAIVEELNRLNHRQIVLEDDPLGSLEFSGTIRSDNVDGFVRILQTSFGVDVARTTDAEVRLRTRRG